MSRIEFFGNKNDYSEEEGRQRYLQYLRVASQNSALKESAEYETEPLTVQEKPITEILSDEAEVSRVLQEYLGKLLISPDGRKRNVNETDDEYEQRTNPVMYVITRINADQKKLILTNFAQILADTQGIKMLPRAFIDYIQNYQRLYRETGGVKGFPNTSAVIAEIRALQQLLPNTNAIQQSINNLRGAQAMFKRELRINNAGLNASIADAIARLQNLENTLQNVDYGRIQQMVQEGVQDINQDRRAVPDVDYRRIQQMIQAGVQDVSQDRRVVANDIYGRLIQRLERLPTREELNTLNTIISRQVEGVARNIRQDRLTAQADKQAILRELESAFEQINTMLGDKVNTDDLDRIDEALRDLYGTSREVQTKLEEIGTNMPRDRQEERRIEIYNALVREARAQGRDVESPEVIAQLQGQTNRLINTGGRGLKKMNASFSKKKQYPKMSIISGRGIHIDDEPQFVEFGKYALSLKKLNERRLDAKSLKSGGSIKDLSNVQISEEFCDILTDLIDTQKLNEKYLNKLPSSEKRIFSKLINGSGLYGKYKVKLVPSDKEKEENERFDMVKGIYTAGNDSPEVIRELKQFIIKFMNDGRLPRREGLEVLYELNCSAL